MNWGLRTILIFMILGLICTILIIILVNALRRTFFSGSSEHALRNGEQAEKCVDLFAFELAALPTEHTMPGMTALIDRGVTNLETGIYMQQEQKWIKIHVPEVGDRFFILKGESGGKHYTIRPSFINEVRLPTEVQVLDNDHIYQELHETTSTVYVEHSVYMAPRISVHHNANNPAPKLITAFPIGRSLTIINTSPSFICTLVVGHENVQILPKTSRQVHLNVTNPFDAYTLGAVSPE